MKSEEVKMHEEVLKRLSRKAEVEGRDIEALQLLQVRIALNNLFHEYQAVLETMLELKKEVEDK